MILYFRLQEGLFLILFVSGIIKTWRDAINHESCTSDFNYFKSEIGKNVHYYVGSGLVTAEIFLMTGATPPTVDQGLIEFILTAVLGL